MRRRPYARRRPRKHVSQREFKLLIDGILGTLEEYRYALEAQNRAVKAAFRERDRAHGGQPHQIDIDLLAVSVTKEVERRMANKMARR